MDGTRLLDMKRYEQTKVSASLLDSDMSERYIMDCVIKCITLVAPPLVEKSILFIRSFVWLLLEKLTSRLVVLVSHLLP